MKKIINMFLCIFILLSAICVTPMAEEAFTITSSTVSNGDKNVGVSALMRFEFSENIGDVSDSDITCLPASVGEVEISENVLLVRLAFPKEYNTEYTVDLSAVTSVSGKALADSDRLISFKTKEGIKGKIFEDDFETKTVDASKWRAPASGSGAMQKEGDGGNWSYYIKSGSLDSYTYPLDYPYGFVHKGIFDFDIFIENATADYNFFTILGNNGLTGDELKNFESYWTGLLTYDFEEKTFGVLYNQELYAGAAGSPKKANASVAAKEGWNKIRVFVDIDAATLQLEVNGTLVVDENGNGTFEIPFSSKIGSAGCTLLNIRLSGTANADVYYDNISYRQLDAPILSSSSVAEGSVINVTCPEIKMNFKNDITALSLKINGEAVNSSNIAENEDGSFSFFPSLVWGESYRIDGTMEGLYGTESTFSFDFSVAERKGNLIECAGFYRGEQRIYSVVPGDITAKLKFWQDENQKYLIVAAVYRETEGRTEMISSVSFEEFTTEGNLAEKSVTVTVPEDAENCFVKYFVLKDSISRIPYEKSLFSGNTVLE